MRPIKFKEQNATMMPVEGSRQGRLPVCKTDKGWISCWQLSFMDRIRAVIFGRIWLYNYSPKYHAPVSLVCKGSIFTKSIIPKRGKNRALLIPKKRRKHGR